jgi:hypothetical protein
MTESQNTVPQPRRKWPWIVGAVIAALLVFGMS